MLRQCVEDIPDCIGLRETVYKVDKMLVKCCSLEHANGTPTGYIVSSVKWLYWECYLPEPAIHSTVVPAGAF